MKILHGPYGDAWAWNVDLGEGHFTRGWHVAESESVAIEKAREEISRWRKNPDDAVVDRVQPPLRHPKTGAADNDADGHLTDGEYIDPGGSERASVPFSGACPVQGEGFVDGLACYYRARGNGWSLDVTLSDNECWTYGESDYAWPDGGWIHRDESSANIGKAVTAFRARMRGTE